MSIKSFIRTIPDYPKTGVMFRDLTKLIMDPSGFKMTIDQLIKPYLNEDIDKVAGIEARGFILGGAVANQLGLGIVPIRKKGKLPAETYRQDYQLEYGTDSLEIHRDALKNGDNVLLVDDLVATGGTACAAINLIRMAGGNVMSLCFVIDLPDLGGSKKIRGLGVSTHALCEFEGG